MTQLLTLFERVPALEVVASLFSEDKTIRDFAGGAPFMSKLTAGQRLGAVLSLVRRGPKDIGPDAIAVAFGHTEGLGRVVDKTRENLLTVGGQLAGRYTSHLHDISMQATRAALRGDQFFGLDGVPRRPWRFLTTLGEAHIVNSAEQTCRRILFSVASRS